RNRVERRKAQTRKKLIDAARAMLANDASARASVQEITITAAVVDYTQNAINKTLVAPFSPRPSSGAPVSMPITWDELDDPDLRPDRWTIHTALARLHDTGDPLARSFPPRHRSQCRHVGGHGPCGGR
ncbi:MAG: bifunctional non-ous end joining protein LigD, partial [Pseudonocardiales bacterium]|nr:bifunctional non-ous end joining protein LigD [Pseudonocardiales bacterium]